MLPNVPTVVLVPAAVSSTLRIQRTVAIKSDRCELMRAGTQDSHHIRTAEVTKNRPCFVSSDDSVHGGHRVLLLPIQDRRTLTDNRDRLADWDYSGVIADVSSPFVAYSNRYLLRTMSTSRRITNTT